MNELLQKIKRRCEREKLTTKEYKKEILYLDDDEPKMREGLIVQIPEERDFKNIILTETEELKDVYKSKFHKFKFIKGFEAIWSPSLEIIECEIQTEEPLFRHPSFIIRRLRRYFEPEKKTSSKKEANSFEFPSPNKNITVTIGIGSNEHAILRNFQRDNFYGRGSLRPRPTIKFEGVKVSTHKEAKDFLIKLANTILFQIDMVTNLPLHMASDREILRDLRLSRRKASESELSFKSPKYEYDQEAMSLYWYARTSTNMPLLQFLAFYQVIEFYFPQYSYMEAQKRIRNVIKNPVFDANSDGDIAQILNVVKVTSKGKSFGDERDQIKATIIHCVDKSDLKNFFDESDERKEFFDVQKKHKSVVKQKISFSNPDHDLRSDVANRIYEIRCRIVHTKDELEQELLLPFSQEASQLRYDIDLVEFVARRILIASGRPLKMK